MGRVIANVLMWSEVWALLIPLTIFVRYKINHRSMRPVIIYVITGLILNLVAILISIYRLSLPDFLQNNNILYNLHSVLRVILLGWYINSLQLIRLSWLSKFILPVYLLFVVVNFIFWENPLFLSTRLLSAESIVLLILCLFFLISSMRDDSDTNWLKHPSFLICIGLCFYEAVNFFIFLFFYPLLENNLQFGMLTMKIFSVSYIIFCILLALSLYRSRKDLAAA
ncbi:MAG: hypothetical protein HZB42_05250 [Sphingobacteriales bacterium]|nr:hypothetical protein [Sphingobacteriales bacterium]